MSSSSLAQPIGRGACRSIGSFSRGDKIGEGTYGSVYQARDKASGRLVAIKRVKLGDSTMDREGMPITHLREVGILRALRHHEHIVELLEVVVGSQIDSVFLVFEYLQHDVARLVDTMPTPFSMPEVKCLGVQLLLAVAHLHANHVMHRDLKLSNLLLTNNGELKLCDFGLAREYGYPLGRYTSKVVTLWYRPPELLLGSHTYDTAVDMWGVGCIFGELLQNTPLLVGKSEIHQLELMCKLLGSPNDRIWPGFSDLPNVKKMALPVNPYNELRKKFPKLSAIGHDFLNRLLTYDPEKRITAHDAIQHEYFKREPKPKEISAMPSFPASFPSMTPQKRPRHD